MLKCEKDIILLITEDEWMMEVLETAKHLKLPDWWICAGFIRTKIWDALHGFQDRTPLPDVDVIYYDSENISEGKEKELEALLKSLKPFVPWSVKNQARMHKANHVLPYSSSVDAISKFPETVTALGVRLGEDDELVLTAPCGIHDVINLEVKPTPFFMESEERMEIYRERVKKKNWESIWSNVKITYL